MTKKKAKIIAVASVVIISLLIISMTNHSSQKPPISEVRPVSPSFTSGRDNTPPTENKAVVANDNPEISTQNPPQDSTTTETDFESQTTANNKEISPESSAPKDNPTPTPVPSKSTTTTTACEPKMGDTRTVDGQKQVYFLGFGWIDDNEEPNQGVYVENMYENGNKIGSMGGGTVVDGEGDINKMVGIMD